MVVSGVDVISSGGVESGATISKGGIEKVLSAGLASSSTIDSGGTQIVLSAGTALRCDGQGGGHADRLWPGRDCVRLLRRRAGRRPRRHRRGHRDQRRRHRQGFRRRLVLGGGFFGFTVNSGGVEIANSGGTTSAVAVASGGELIIHSGGTGIGTTIRLGGQELVSAGGKSIAQSAPPFPAAAFKTFLTAAARRAPRSRARAPSSSSIIPVQRSAPGSSAAAFRASMLAARQSQPPTTRRKMFSLRVSQSAPQSISVHKCQLRRDGSPNHAVGRPAAGRPHGLRERHDRQVRRRS